MSSYLVEPNFLVAPRDLETVIMEDEEAGDGE
jgi:hypothetical protein